MGRLDRHPEHDSRQEMRYPTNFRSILYWNGNFAFVQVADISSKGIHVIGDFLPETSQKVRIGARQLNAHGRIAWRTAHSCGIELEEPILALRVVRANAYPGSREVTRGEALGAIRINDLAAQLLDMFPSEADARSFLQDSLRAV